MSDKSALNKPSQAVRRFESHRKATLWLVLSQTAGIVVLMCLLLPLMRSAEPTSSQAFGYIVLIGAVFLHVVLIGSYNRKTWRLLEACSLADILRMALAQPGNKDVRRDLYRWERWQDQIAKLDASQFAVATEVLGKLLGRCEAEYDYSSRQRIPYRARMVTQFLNTIESQLVADSRITTPGVRDLMNRVHTNLERYRTISEKV
jgi:hypothetical protein